MRGDCAIRRRGKARDQDDVGFDRHSWACVRGRIALR
jgi:hypothetical protein